MAISILEKENLKKKKKMLPRRKVTQESQMLGAKEEFQLKQWELVQRYNREEKTQVTWFSG